MARDDLIRREDVQVRLHKLLDKLGDPGARSGVSMALMQLEGMKPVEAEPVVHARLEYVGGKTWRCTNCGHRVAIHCARPAWLHFCEECGANLDGGNADG